MRFMIVGVGQTFNFETRQMDDVLQVQAPDGSMLSVPTTNEAAQALIQMAMNGHAVQQVSPPAPREDDPMGQQLAAAFQQAGDRPVAVESELSGRVEERFQPPEDAGDFPDGASIFGGEVSEAQPEEPMGLADGSMVQAQVQQKQLFAKTQKASKASLGLRRNSADRSGVPSYGISRVDEKGNPVLPAAPDNTIEDDEDPGEQV